MPDAICYRWSEIPEEQVTLLLDRKLLTGERVMLAHVHLKKGCLVPRHQHVHEQLTYVLAGALHFWIGEMNHSRRRFVSSR